MYLEQQVQVLDTTDTGTWYNMYRNMVHQEHSSTGTCTETWYLKQQVHVLGTTGTGTWYNRHRSLVHVLGTLHGYLIYPIEQ